MAEDFEESTHGLKKKDIDDVIKFQERTINPFVSYKDPESQEMKQRYKKQTTLDFLADNEETEDILSS